MKYPEMYKHTHSTNRGGVERAWRMPDLWDLAAELPVREVYPTDLPEFEHFMNCQTGNIWWSRGEGIKGSFKMWDMRRHCERVMQADLSYPILLNPLGGLMDGAHRVIKALILGVPLKVVQFTEWPESTL